MQYETQSLSISQLCDSGCDVAFRKDQCIVRNYDKTQLFIANKQSNMHKINMKELLAQKVSCLMTAKEDHLT